MHLTLEDLDTITLNYGSHDSPKEGHCLLEVVALFAGEKFGDKPECVDFVLASFGRSWNDGMRSDAERAQLKQYITRLPGTNKGPALSQKRGWMAMDWLIRVHTAAWLALSPGLAHHAETLKALPPITCTAELVAAQPKIDAARQDARAARDAARDAAWDAAGDAAWVAAGDAAWVAAWVAARDAAWDAAWVAAGGAAGGAAWDAARDVAGGAAWDAAWDAAWVAAGGAAGAKLEPTVLALLASAHELYSAMISAEI